MTRIYSHPDAVEADVLYGMPLAESDSDLSSSLEDFDNSFNELEW